jgi:GMP synthase-like glutamine amidotransferase
MRIHSLIHAEFEGLGTIHEWIETNRHDLSVTRLFENDPFPSMDKFDSLIIMGGPMSVNEEDIHPWIKPEKEFISTAISSKKKVIGICFGAQIIARSLGAEVKINQVKERGWFPINKIFTFDEYFPDFDQFSGQTVFHWHGETFDIPQGSARLFESAGCKNQGFIYNNQVMGLQFHLEMNEKSLNKMFNYLGTDYGSGKFIQSKEEILDFLPKYYPDNRRILFTLLDKFLFS